MTKPYHLTRDEVFDLPADAYGSVAALRNAISRRYACGISDETAARIIRDRQHAEE